RYMVDEVAVAIAFYTKFLDFKVLTSFVPAFADVARGNLRLLLSGPTSSAGRPMPDGAKPGPGGEQILLQDPSGNLIELFEPAADRAPRVSARKHLRRRPDFDSHDRSYEAVARRRAGNIVD